MIQLGKLIRIDDLRKIWPDEARDFTPWLAEAGNLAVLSEAINIPLELEERESAVGNFSADIYAVDTSTGKKVIIENQLEETNHDHLGKLITYTSGKEASVVIWVVRRAREEHRKAIEWLNEHTDDFVGFFLVEIELWKIGDSDIAPKFNIVEQPNGWAKSMKNYDSYTTGQQRNLNFWQEFVDYVENDKAMTQTFSRGKPSINNWYNFAVGKSAYKLSLTINYTKKFAIAQLYFDANGREQYMEYLKNKEDIQEMMGVNVEWKAMKKESQGFTTLSNVDYDSPEGRKAVFNWFCEQSLLWKKVVVKYNF